MKNTEADARTVLEVEPSNGVRLSERDLVAQAASGNPEAFSSIYRKYERQLFRTAVRDYKQRERRRRRHPRSVSKSLWKNRYVSICLECLDIVDTNRYELCLYGTTTSKASAIDLTQRCREWRLVRRPDIGSEDGYRSSGIIRRTVTIVDSNYCPIAAEASRGYGDL